MPCAPSVVKVSPREMSIPARREQGFAKPAVSWVKFGFHGLGDGKIMLYCDNANESHN